MKPLFTSPQWTIETIEKTLAAIEDIAKNKYGLDYYTPQVELITSKQMISCFCSHAMPVMYEHWSFGKQYTALIENYDRDMANLTYEVVINTNPCIAYLVDSNSMTMQALVLAHAAIGHNFFFKNNYLFQEHTNADSILDYLKYAKKYISDCRKNYGVAAVEQFLTVCHVLQHNSIDKYRRRHKSKAKLESEEKQREKYKQQYFDPIMDDMKKKRRRVTKLLVNPWTDKTPEDNLLYFVEKNALHLKEWQRESIRIVRKTAQYFYPQILTKLNNEATASFWHYTIMNDLADQGLITEGSRLEFLQSHSNVLTQLGYVQSDRQINPYALGFKIYQDIKRMCQNPTQEDRDLYPHIAGKNWLDVVKEMSSGYSDASLIANYLTPNVAKDMKLFCLLQQAEEDLPEDVQEMIDYEDVSVLRVEATHDPKIFKTLRKAFSEHYLWENMIPKAEIVYADFFDKKMTVKTENMGVESKRNLSDALGYLSNCRISFVE